MLILAEVGKGDEFVSVPFHFLTQGGASLATAAIVQICRGTSPRYPIMRSAVIVSESIVLIAALVTGQLKWSSLPDILFTDVIAAVCATQILQGHDLESQVDTQNHDPVVLIVGVIEETLSPSNARSLPSSETKNI
jgi:hypothetical protein